MVTNSIGWKAGDGTFHATKEEAIAHDLEQLFDEAKPYPCPEDFAEWAAKWVAKHQDAFRAALEVKTDPKLKVRKPRSDKGKKKPSFIVATAVPVKP